MKYAYIVLAFFKVAGLSIRLGAFTQKTWGEYKNNNADIGIENLDVWHS